MALTDQQKRELDIASQRKLAGQATPTDVANLSYAQQQFGYSYSPQTIVADQPTEQSVNLGTPQPDTTGANGMVSGASTTPNDIQSYITAFTAPQTAEQTQADQLTKSITDLLGQTGGQEQALAQEEQAKGVNQLQTQLGDVNAQITSGLAEYEDLRKAYEATSIENRGKPVGMNFIIGNEAQIQFAKAAALNQKASAIGLAQAQASGLQGRIDTAKAQAKQAVDLRYAPILEQLNIKQQQLAALEPILTKQEKIQAQALQQMYNDQQTQVEAQQAEEQQLADFALDAMNKYRDAGIKIGDSYETIQNKIQLSPTYKTDQAQEQASLQRTQQLAGGGGGTSGTTFTPTEKKKLEQAGLSTAPRQEQLDFLYGKDATNNSQFYIDRIKEGSVDYLNTDGTINWPAVPAALRQEVFDALEAEETTEQPKVGVMDVIKELPGAVKEIGGKIGGYIKNFFNLF